MTHDASPDHSLPDPTTAPASTRNISTSPGVVPAASDSPPDLLDTAPWAAPGLPVQQTESLAAGEAPQNPTETAPIPSLDTFDREAAEGPREELLDPTAADTAPWHVGSGGAMQPYVSIFLLLLAVLPGLLFFELQGRFVEAAIERGRAHGAGLVGSAEDLTVRGDDATLQARIDDLELRPDIAYVLTTAADGSPSVHNFRPTVPQALTTSLQDRPSGRAEPLVYEDPVDGTERRVFDLTLPVAGSELGFVRVGVDPSAARRQALDIASASAAGLALVGLLGGLWLRIATRRRWAPLAQIGASLDAIAVGNYAPPAIGEVRGDAGRLTESLNRALLHLQDPSLERESDRPQTGGSGELRHQIRHLADLAELLAAGKLRGLQSLAAGDGGDELDVDRLRRALAHVAANTAETVLEARAAADALELQAADMLEKSRTLGVGAQVQSRDAAGTGEQVEQVARSIRQVSADAVTSADAARRTKTAAESGRQAMRRSLEGMQRIRREVQVISQRIKGLGDRSLEVSEVVDTMTTIAAQTNLLALNAAIEASGAGEEGVRFAVVADEVRRLAEDAARASKRIAALIRTIQTEVQDAVVAMEKGTQEVENGYRVTHEADERLEEAARESDASAQLARSIAENAGAHVDGIAKVSHSVGSMAELARQAEDTVVQSRDIARELHAQAERLSLALEPFELP